MLPPAVGLPTWVSGGQSAVSPRDTDGTTEHRAVDLALPFFGLLFLLLFFFLLLFLLVALEKSRAPSSARSATCKVTRVKELVFRKLRTDNDSHSCLCGPIFKAK